ncbi:ArsR/SmtB family transcription factor [Ktedonobacter racemifer]|uniref:Transcriptional regulator, ArsR family n=1 Tax=Ktedonobacter racemifer DSM 44963 TaxID=485913 RepID=D6TXW3_KTERA|nr:helix-turn-helix domain-containing protein [Ktedonobacter racemifer]EFH84959.1 transcriptional regulator, ArsR family [Ktedonobacter racemifer DSM 44963]
MSTHHQRDHLSLLTQPDAETTASASDKDKDWRATGLEEDAGLVLLLEALANPVRFRLLRLLTREEGTLCVRELVERIPRTQPVVSHHLRILLFAGFLGVKRLGNHAYYYILPDKLKEVREGLASVEHLLQQRREDQL